MKEGLKKIVRDCKSSILFYTVVYAILYIVSKLILSAIGIGYRQYINYFSIILILIGIILSVIRFFIKSKPKRTRICIIVCSISIISVIVICSPIILLFIAFLPPEHVVEKDNKKYVAYVHSWLDTRVDYYDYINFLLVGKTKRIEDFYNDVGRDVLAEEAKGQFTPSHTTYYNKEKK